MEAQIAFAALAVAVIAWQAYQNARLHRLIETLTLRAFYLKGLNPAVVDPDHFGPQAMANSFRSAFPPPPTPVEDEDLEAKRAAQMWEAQAEEYQRRQALAEAASRPT